MNGCFAPGTVRLDSEPSCLCHGEHLECFFRRLKIRLKVLAEILYLSEKDKSVSQSYFLLKVLPKKEDLLPSP